MNEDTANFAIQAGTAIQKFQEAIINLKRPDIPTDDPRFREMMATASMVSLTLTIQGEPKPGIFETAMQEIEEGIRAWDERL